MAGINVKECAKPGSMKNFGIIRKDTGNTAGNKARAVGGKKAPAKRVGSKY